MLRQKRGREDLHESDAAYMEKSYKTYVDLSQRYGWKTINCAENNFARSSIDIEQDVFRLVEEMLIS
jgi:dTMP kinase